VLSIKNGDGSIQEFKDTLLRVKSQLSMYPSGLSEAQFSLVFNLI